MFFPTAFKKAKVIPLPKTKPVSTDLNGRGGGGGGGGEGGMERGRGGEGDYIPIATLSPP